LDRESILFNNNQTNQN